MNKQKYFPKREENPVCLICSFSIMATKDILVFAANGSEEIETIGTVDVLRRAGFNVVLTSIHETKEIAMSRGVHVLADATLSEVLKTHPQHKWDAVIVPGGMPGARNIASCKDAQTITTEQFQAGRLVAAICAAPAVVLLPWGILDRPKTHATCHPGFESHLRDKGVFEEGVRVSVSQNVVTSRGPGTAVEFALAIIEILCGAEMAKKVADPMLPLLSA